MATATYNAGAFTGGLSTDPLYLDDLAAAAGSPLTRLLDNVVQQTTDGISDIYLRNGSHADLTGGLVLLHNTANGQEQRLGLAGTVTIGADDDLLPRDLIIVSGPYDTQTSAAASTDIIESTAVVQCADKSRLVIIYAHEETATSYDPGARAIHRITNNNAGSAIRCTIRSGPAAQDRGWEPAAGNNVNGRAYLAWRVGPNVAVRDIEIHDGYIEFRPSSTWAPPTRAVFNSRTSIRFWGTANFTDSNAMVFGSADESFSLLVGAGSHWLHGIRGSSGSSTRRVVYVNLDGPDLATQLAVYSSGQRIRFENHLVLDALVVDAAGVGIADAEIRLHVRRPSYSVADNDVDAAVTFPDTSQVRIATTGSDGAATIGVATGSRSQSVTIEAFWRSSTSGSGDVNNSYSTAADSRAAHAAHNELTYDVFAFGYEIVTAHPFTAALSGQAGAGKQTLGTILLPDAAGLTAETSADVPASAANSDDLHDMVYDFCITNRIALPGTVTGTVFDVGARNVTLGASTETLAVSDTAITIPCDSTVTRGMTVTGLLTTGTVTIADTVTVTAGITDTQGKRMNVLGLPFGHDAVAGAWPMTQGDTDRTGIITGTVDSATATNVVLHLDPDTDYHFVADAVSYHRTAVLPLHPATQDDVEVTLRKIADAEGNDLIHPAADLTADEAARLALITYSVADDTITFGATTDHNEYTFVEVSRAIEVGQSTEAALADPDVCVVSLGQLAFEPAATRMISRASGIAASLVPDLREFRFAKIGSTDPKDFVDYSAGAIVVNTGPPTVAALTVDDVSMMQATFDALMADVPTATRELYHGAAGDGSGTSGGASAAQLVTAIKAADFPTVAGEDDRLGSLLHALTDRLGTGGADLTTRIAAIPTDDIDVSALTDSTHGLAALRTLILAADDATLNTTYGLEALHTLIAAIPTANPTAADLAAEVTGATIETGLDLQAALRVVLAVLAGPTTVDTTADQVTHQRLDADNTDAVRITLGDTDGQRTTSELL